MAPQRRHPNVVNVADLKPEAGPPYGKRFDVALRLLGEEAGGVGLGCMHHTLEPGKASFPYHFHCGVEEAMYVLEGTGSLRIGEKTIIVSAGDYVAFPAGPEGAHQMINTSTASLKYLGFSTQTKSDVVVYPDSNVIGARGGDWGPNMWVRSNFKMTDKVPYGFGEKDE